MRRAQESGGFRRTGSTVGASSASGYGYSASDGTGYTGMGDRRNASVVRATPTPSAHHHTPGVVVDQPRHHQQQRDVVVERSSRPGVVTTVTYVTRGEYCRKCGEEVPADARFCEHCGEARAGVAPRCPNPNCREHLSPGVRFCPTCGARV